ncbi:MAG: efflux RND transporter periplasmic adaptor subunit [Chthoniobacterales bacterium]
MISAQKMNVAARAAVPGERDRKVSRKGTYVIGAIIVLVVAFLLFRLLGGSKKEQAPPPPRLVTVAPAITKDVPLYLDEIGTCAANESVKVQAQVAGQIVSRDFKDGADIKKGEVLFTIDKRPYQAALDSAKADDTLAQANLKRQTDLKAKGVTATQDLDTAKANAMRTSAALEAAQVNLDYATIRSPIDGRAGLRQVDVGNTVSPGSSGAVLVQIDNLDPIYTDFTVSEPDLPLVRKYLNGPNLKVLSDAENDGFPPQEGHLYFIANTVQPGTGTILARAISPNPKHQLWPSQFVHVRLVLDVLKNAVLVPSGAIQIGEKGPYLFVVKPDSTLDLRQVTTGQKQDNDMTVVTKGVKAGESVVTAGQLQLAPGQKVVVKNSENSARSESGKANPAS